MKLTHLNKHGHAQMVDIGAKADTKRSAEAQGFLEVSTATLRLLKSGKTKKGDVLATARIAGMMAAKQTSSLIPLCHPLALTRVNIDVKTRPKGIEVLARCECTGKTGVEMEALTAASVTLLTLYDMLKAHDRGMSFQVTLVEKSGGRSGSWKRT